MSDTVNDPEPTTDPPTNSGGGGTSGEPENIEPEVAVTTDPPINTGGGGGNA